jgi:hypothetical protein
MARLVFAFVIGLLLTQSANAQNTKPLTTEELASHTIYRRAVERQSQESDAEFASHHLWSPTSGTSRPPPARVAHRQRHFSRTGHSH